MKGFAGFCPILVLRCLPQCSWRSVVGNFRRNFRHRTMAMTIVRVHAHTFTTSVPYSRPDMIRCGSLMESFEELLQRLMIRRVPQCFVEVDARSDRVLIRNTNTDTEQQSTTNTALDGHQTSALGIPEQHLC